MPTRTTSTQGRSKSRGTRTARTPAASRTRKNPATVAAKRISDSVGEVRRNPAKLKSIGKYAAVAAGLFTTGMLLRRKG